MIWLLDCQQLVLNRRSSSIREEHLTGEQWGVQKVHSFSERWIPLEHWQEANERIEQLEVEMKEARGTAERARVEARQTEESSEGRDQQLREARQEIASLGEERGALR